MMRYKRNKYAIESIKMLQERERITSTRVFANADAPVSIPFKMLLAVSAGPRMGNTRGRQLAIASKKIQEEEMAATRKFTNLDAPVYDDIAIATRLAVLEEVIISLVSKHYQENEAAESKNRTLVATIEKLEAKQSQHNQEVKDMKLKFDCFASKHDLEKEVAEKRNRTLVDTIENLEAQQSKYSQEIKDFQLNLETKKLSLDIRSTSSMIGENDTIISTDNDQKQMSPISKEKDIIYSFRDDCAPNNTSTTCHSPVDISIKNEVWNETDVRVNPADIVRSTTAVSSSEVDYSTIYSPFNGTKLCNWGSSDTSRTTGKTSRTAGKTNSFVEDLNNDPRKTLSMVTAGTPLTEGLKQNITMSYNKEYPRFDEDLMPDVPSPLVDRSRMLAVLAECREEQKVIEHYFEMKGKEDDNAKVIAAYNKIPEHEKMEYERQQMEWEESSSRTLNRIASNKKKRVVLKAEHRQGRLDAILRREEGLNYDCDDKIILDISFIDELTPDVVKKKYRESALVFHPDKSKADKEVANTHFRIVKDAYDNLNNAYEEKKLL